ncbi:rod shape-determining protein MreD, partial [Limosilactobacillus fermentum]|nr:rod shape-determining protein MreD [Limosilactobacillus fermentum]
ALLELLNYWAYYLVGVTRVGFAGFLLDTLGPTLALNLVYFILLYWPVHRLYQRALGEQH